MNDGLNDDDGDSLFGSPPPSPQLSRGRSLSLALPGCANDAGGPVLQNVGTIALPGSHTGAESVVVLPASPPRRSARPVDQAFRSIVPQNLSRNERPATQCGSSTRPKKTTRRKEKTLTSASIVNRLPLTLPDSNEPTPPNFLRNQQALLGLAGVVGGVKPAQLATRLNRGSSSSNPIIVEDDNPPIGSASWRARQPQLPSDLPPPSSEEIVSTLVAQRNIFPVLRSLLPLVDTRTDVGCCSGGSSNHFHPNTPSSIAHPPQSKKRKLNNVPAGASDWDIPFPFSASEGPKGYRTEWEKERGKRLIQQLVTLVKEAVQKATTKAYVQEKKREKQEAERRIATAQRSYYRQSVSVHGLGSGSAAFDSSQTSGSGSSTPIAQLSSPPPLSDWGQLDFTSSSLQTDLEAWLDAVNAQGNSNDDSLSVPSGETCQTAVSSPTLSSSTRLPTPSDFGLPGAVEESGKSSIFDQVPGSDILGFNFDFAIDPVLLDPNPLLSTPVTQPPSTTPSTQLMIPSNPQSGQSQVSPSTPLLADITTVNNIPNNVPISAPSRPLPSSTSFYSSSSLSSQRSHSQSRFIPFTPPISSTSRTSQPAPKPRKISDFDRQDILRRAKLRREQLTAEIARAKVEMWETTIEQAVLVNLSKDNNPPAS